MRTKFPGHFRASDSAIRELWSTGIVVLDANVLLNLYRYSDSSRSEFIRLLKKLGTRIWIPHQACKEFLNNRLGTIVAQETEYSDAVGEIDAIEKKFKDDRSHPFLPSDLLAQLGEVFDKTRKHLSSERESLGKRTSEDPVLNEVEQLISDKIGDAFSIEQLAAIYKEGADRYKRRIPPGFKDAAKPDEAGDDRKFGDLVLWKEILAEATGKKTGVIFVTDDRKEDWWLMVGSKTIGPRPELIAEFKAAVGEDFLQYQPHRFLEYAKRFLGEEVTPRTIEEARVRRETSVHPDVAALLDDHYARRTQVEHDLAYHTRIREALLSEIDMLGRKIALDDPAAAPWSELKHREMQLNEAETALHNLGRAEGQLRADYYRITKEKPPISFGA